jgi:hypothetical protein
MLKLRRATVVEALAGDGREQELVIELDGRKRPAVADVALVGAAHTGDELIVNVEALDLGLGSGGFDVVHVNLTRGLEAGGNQANVMKLNFTSLQHAVKPVDDERLSLPVGRPVAVLALHGQLAPVAWAFAQAEPPGKLGFVQTEGGALPGGHSRTVRTLRERGLLAGHLTAGASFGGEAEAITLAGAIHHGLSTLCWDAAVCGPGPGIVGSNSPLGHGGMSALDCAHTALALGCPALLVARMSSGDERARHRGLSHHTLTVLDLLLEPVTVALPSGSGFPVAPELRASLEAVPEDATSRTAISDSYTPPRTADERAVQSTTHELGRDRPARIARHDWRSALVDLSGYAASGLPAETMGRGLSEDPLFFASALAGGSVLAGFSEPGLPSHVGGADRSSPASPPPGKRGDAPVSDGSSPPQALSEARGEACEHSEGALLAEAKPEG